MPILFFVGFLALINTVDGQVERDLKALGPAFKADVAKVVDKISGNSVKDMK